MKLFAKKSLGQHFLNSKHVLSQIIEASQVKEGDLVLEIGPGTGVLTRALLEKGAQVVAVEKDRRAIEALKNEEWSMKNVNKGEEKKEERETDNQNTPKNGGLLSVVEGDILETDIDALLSPFFILHSSFSIVANIPYYITGAILEKFLEHGPRPEKMVLLVQKEVAERIVARDGKESVLSMSVKAFGEPKIVAKVPRGAFTPPPTVESAILMIENISDQKFYRKNSSGRILNGAENLESNEKVQIPLFFAILKAGFAHKRKFLKKNLEILENIEINGEKIGLNKEKIDLIWKKLELDEKVRAEDLKLEKWLEISSF